MPLNLELFITNYCYLGRILYLRWDGNNTLGVAGVFALPVTLEACKSYVFKGKGAWNSNASAGTLTVAVNSTSDNTGTNYGSGSIVCGTQYSLINGTFTFSVPTAGTYYLTFTSNVASLNAVADLSITENIVESMSVSTASLFFDGLHLSKSFTVAGNTLANDITLSAPAGITFDKTTITKAEAQCGVLVTATYDNATAIPAGTISITSGALSQSVSVIALADNCFTPLYNDRTNLIPDPLLNSLTGFTNSWGTKTIATGAEAYCGYGSAKLTGVNGASVTTPAITWLPNTSYRVRAMINTDGGFQFGFQNTYAVEDPAVATYEKVLESTSGAWQQVDHVFTTGATATPGFIYFNMQNRGGTLGYIDNWELYQIPTVLVAESTISALACTLGSTDTKTINVSGTELSGNVVLAITGLNANCFSLSSGTLAPTTGTLNSTAVTLTYTPLVHTIGDTATLTVSSGGLVYRTFSLSAATINTGLDLKPTAFNILVLNKNLSVIGVNRYAVYNLDGIKVAEVIKNEAGVKVPLQVGVYIVRSDKGIQKVIVN